MLKKRLQIFLQLIEKYVRDINEVREDKPTKVSRKWFQAMKKW